MNSKTLFSRKKTPARDGKVWEKLLQAHGECVEKYGRK